MHFQKPTLRLCLTDQDDALLVHHSAPGADGRDDLRHLLLDRQEVGELASVSEGKGGATPRVERDLTGARITFVDSGSVARGRGSRDRFVVAGA